MPKVKIPGRLTSLSLFALIVLAFAQRPGKVTFDTKLDLSVDPAGFMQRALHLWNPMATSGELQNQAYGYLFPIGPFFAVGHSLGVPVWVSQRLWCALLLCVAFGGVLSLARSLNIGSEPSRHIGALAYALAPRMLTEIGTLSSEMLPAALLPWVLLPLVNVHRIGSLRRATVLSALAVLYMGGINAAMVVMALVMPGLWLLTRVWTRAHVALVGWWCAAVAACTLWWILPLLLLGRYSLPFLAYIESSANTTAVVSLFQAVRGTNQWVAYVVLGEPWWPAGWMLVDSPVLMFATIAVAAIGLAGLATRGLPERRFLVLSMLAGLVLLTVGFVGALDSPLSGAVRHLLDGPLAPLRNVHKFEPVLRLPLALGFVHAVGALVVRGRVRIRGVDPIPAVALLLVAVMAAPAWLLALRPGPGWGDLPAHWRAAATWLGEQDAAARTLLVPGTGFGQYTWGRTVDEPIQALAKTPWAVRSQVPLGSEGNTRTMDTVEEVLAAGRGSAHLADYLARNGYRYVLLRNDIDRYHADAPPIGVIRQALGRSPGITLAASFGPQLNPPDDSRSPVDDVRSPPPAIEIYQVDRPVPQVRGVLAGDVAVVSGGPESLLPLLEQDLLDARRPVLFAGDLSTDEAARSGDRWVVTDGLRRRERNVGRANENLSQTLTIDEAPRQHRATLDVVPFPGYEHQTVAVYQGIRSVSASSSASFADAWSGSEPSYLPFAAVDGDPATAWHSSTLTGPGGQWLEISLDTPRRLGDLQVGFVDDLRVGWRVTRFRLTTDHGSVDYDARPGTATYPVPPGGLVTTVRVTVLGVDGGRTTGNVGIREVVLPGTAARRALRVPADTQPASGPPAYGFSRGYQPRPACFRAATEIRCDPTLERVGEEPNGIERLFRTPAAGRYGLRLTAVTAPGGVSPVRTGGLAVEASSWLSGDPLAGAYAAVDGDATTAWLADVGDGQPTLRLRWVGPRPIEELTVRFADPPVASRPTKLEIRTPTERREVEVRPDGRATFPALVTDSLDVTVTTFEPEIADRRGNGAEAMPGLAELDVPALADLRAPLPGNTPFALPCGEGPLVELDGIRFKTAISGTFADWIEQRPLPVSICDLFAADSLDLPAGEHRLRTERSPHFVIQDAALRPAGWTATAPRERATTVQRWDATHRRVRVDAGEEALIVVAENANAGWRATLGGTRLRTVRVDGWQQAWVVPAGPGGTVALDFTPDRTYRGGLAVGGVAALVVVLLAAWPVRRRRGQRPGGRDRSVPQPVPSTGYWITALLVALVVALAGVVGVALLIAGAIARELRVRALPWVALGGAGLATAVAVAGRLAGYGQDWAYGTVAQFAMLSAVCAGVVSATVRIPGGGAQLDADPGEDQQPGGDRGGGRDFTDRTGKRPADQPRLDADRQPHQQDRAHVGAGDARVQQQLRHREEAAGEREQPEWSRDGAIFGSAYQGQKAPAVPLPRRDYRYVEGDDHGNGRSQGPPAAGTGEPWKHDDAHRLR
jgi:arabinofuranan 3-O-arabinosyltransferase